MRFIIWLLLGMMLASRLAAAVEEKPPFELPVNEMWSQVIPGGQGMKFFQGEWDYIGRGGMIRVTVTPKAFVSKYDNGTEKGFRKTYRIMYEASNYVLLATLAQPEYETNPGHAWTGFAVLTLRSDGNGDRYIQMIYFYCGLPFMNETVKAFHWPKARLMELFESKCPVVIDPDDLSWFGEGWSHIYYQPFERCARGKTDEGYCREE